MTRLPRLPGLNRKIRHILIVVLGACVAVFASSAGAADLVVASYGGVWQTATQKCFVEPYEKRTGKSVDVVLGTSSEWMNQISASPGKPPVDLFLAAPDGVIDAVNRNISDALDAKHLPVLSELDPTLLKQGLGHAVVVGYSSLGLAYNKDVVKDPPKTWDEFIKGTEAGKWNVAIPGMRQASTPDVVLWFLAYLKGGGADNINPAFDTIAKMKAGGKMHVWNDMNQFLTELETGDTDIGMYWEGRTWAFHDAGNSNVGFIKPKPIMPIHSTLVLKAKNSSPLAWDFLNQMLGSQAMSCFGNMIQYGTGNAHVKYSPTIQSRITRSNEIVVPPYDRINAHMSQWVERWNKEVGN